MRENESDSAKGKRRDIGPLLVVGGEAVAAAVVAGTLTEGVGLVVGAASIPIFNAALSSLLDRRAASFRRQLEEAGFNDEALAKRFRDSPELIEILSEATEVALKTDLHEKQALLARVLASTAQTSDEFARGWARRVISAIGRIDVAEVEVLRLVEKGTTDPAEIADHLLIDDSDAVDSVVAVLESEGAVRSTNREVKITGFGRRILQELRAPQR